MALSNVPFIIDGGVEHLGPVIRRAMFDASGGVEGISGVSDLKVQAQSVPNGSVRVMPGGATLLNRYPGGDRQSYTGFYNESATAVQVSPTGSAGGRTDVVIARILDPNYEGQPPADPNDFAYNRLETIEGVPAGITKLSVLNLKYPAILLARVTIPANTGTITNAMITDLRTVARPQRETEMRTYALTAADKETLASTLAYPRGETFPNAGNIWGAIDIPSWATRMKIVMSWTGIMAPAGNAFGGLWVQVGQTADPGHKSSQYVSYDTPNSSGNSRFQHIAADNMHVPVAMRGTSQYFHPYGNVNAATASASRIFMDAGSSLVLQVEFAEQAD